MASLSTDRRNSPHPSERWVAEMVKLGSPMARFAPSSLSATYVTRVVRQPTVEAQPAHPMPRPRVGRADWHLLCPDIARRNGAWIEGRSRWKRENCRNRSHAWRCQLTYLWGVVAFQGRRLCLGFRQSKKQPFAKTMFSSKSGDAVSSKNGLCYWCTFRIDWLDSML